VKDEGFLSPAGKRFVLFATVLILGGLLVYYVVAEDISIDLDELTETSTTDVSVPDVTVPEVGEDPYFRCVEEAATAQEILDCTNR